MSVFASGSFLSRERLRLVAGLLLVAYVVGIAVLLGTAHGLNDLQGRPLGTDFSNMVVAGTQVREGRPEAPYDPARQQARAEAMFGPDTPHYGWHYPPPFLALATLSALPPYLLSLLLWQGVTLLLYLVVIRFIGAGEADETDRRGHSRLPIDWLLVALAYPAVFDNLGHGQNGFLTAALLGGGLVLLPRRPVLAGLLFGLLCYKPHFGLLLPLALVCGGHGRAFVAAAGTVALVIAASWLGFGGDTWRAFFASLPFTREVLEQGGPGWPKIQSVFAWVRMWGGSITSAYAAQGLVTLGVALSLGRLWRGTAAHAVKAAALCLGVVIATPYSLDYDMMALAPAIAFLAVHGLRHRFLPFEKSALALLWLCPLLSRPVAEFTLIPLAVPAMLAVYGLTLRRAASRGETPTVAARPEPR